MRVGSTSAPHQLPLHRRRRRSRSGREARCGTTVLPEGQANGMLRQLMVVSMTVLLGSSGLACGSKARSSADAAPGAGTGGTSGAGGALDGGASGGNAAGGSAAGDAGAGGAGGITTAGAGGAAGMTSAGAGGAAGSSDGGDDASADAATTDAGPDVPICTPDVTCRPAEACKTGVVSCDTGVARCVVTGNQPNGTVCGTNVFCVSGFCNNEGCGQTCTPANHCHKGTISCTTGTNICQDTGTSLPDGTSCGTNQACQAGVCVTVL